MRRVWGNPLSGSSSNSSGEIRSSVEQSLNRKPPWWQRLFAPAANWFPAIVCRAKLSFPAQSRRSRWRRYDRYILKILAAERIIDGPPMSMFSMISRSGRRAWRRSFEGVEVHDNHVDGHDAVFLDRTDVGGVFAPMEDAPVDHGVERLDAAVEHFREAREFGDILTAMPASRRSFAVPPVETSSTSMAQGAWRTRRGQFCR